MRPLRRTVSAGCWAAACAGKSRAEIKKGNIRARRLSFISCPRNCKVAAGFSRARRPRHTLLEGWRRVHPQHNSISTARIAPLMRHGAFEIEAVARFQPILFAAQRNLELPTQNE